MPKQAKVLVLGVGRDLTQRLNTDPTSGPYFADNFEEVVTVDRDWRVEPTYCFPLEHDWPKALRNSDFDEVHAYEVLHLVGRSGSAADFFALWRRIWDALKPGGLVFAMVPWWESVWTFQDPSTTQVYSEEKLKYLDQAKSKGPMFTQYTRYWPNSYNFIQRLSEMRGTDPKNAGYIFVLQKADPPGDSQD